MAVGPVALSLRLALCATVALATGFAAAGRSAAPAPYNPHHPLGIALLPSGAEDASADISSVVLPGGVAAMVLFALLLWMREQRLRKQRERLRRTFQLGEEILGAVSLEAIQTKITEGLPGILGVTRAQLYAYNRGSKTLDTVSRQTGQPVSISLASPPPGTYAGAVACYHYRTLLVIPDISRSPFPMTGADSSIKSLLFVPMLGRGEVMGVLELGQEDRARDFTADEQALAQHLANQAAVAMRLLEQRSVQEQLFRTEKMAAVGRLITGIVNELQTPLASISDLARKAQEKGGAGTASREIAAIGNESEKASAMVARLISFEGREQTGAHPVCVTRLLQDLIRFREGDWKASGIRLRDLISRENLFVVGAQGQLEQVFLNLLVYVEQSLANAQEKRISIRTSVLSKRLLVEIAFPASPERHKAEDIATALGITRSVVAGHGGEVRIIEKANEDSRFEVELPLSAHEQARTAATVKTPEAGRQLTILVIEGEEGGLRQLLALLESRGCRVIPVSNSDSGLELAQRMRFDIAFCSVHAPGLNWVELSERLQSRVGAFVLISGRYDPELVADFEEDGRFVISKPIQEGDIDRVLASAERPSAERHGSIDARV